MTGTWRQLYDAGHHLVTWPTWRGGYLELYKNHRNDTITCVAKDEGGRSINDLQRPYEPHAEDDRWQVYREDTAVN